MKQFVIVVIGVIAVIACGPKSSTESSQSKSESTPTTGDAMSPADASTPMIDATASPQGMWRIPPGQRSRTRPGIGEMPGTTRFLLDGETVTLFLVTEKMWMWKSPDDHYRLKAQWVGDELQYLPPFGRWTKLATFEHGRFESDGTTEPWVYERVTDAMKDADDRILDQPRTLHDYSIKPTDKPKP